MLIGGSGGSPAGQVYTVGERSRGAWTCALLVNHLFYFLHPSSKKCMTPLTQFGGCPFYEEQFDTPCRVEDLEEGLWGMDGEDLWCILDHSRYFGTDWWLISRWNYDGDHSTLEAESSYFLDSLIIPPLLREIIKCGQTG